MFVMEIKTDGKRHPKYKHLICLEDGRIYSEKSKKFVGCVGVHGYKRVFVGDKTIASHRLTLEAWSGKVNAAPHCDHINGNKLDNRVKNLRWASVKENADNTMRLGRMSRGPDHGRSKLNEHDVVEMMTLVREGFPKKGVAEAYGVNDSIIYQIEKGKIWRHVEWLKRNSGGEPNG